MVSVAGPGTRTDKDRRTMAVLLGAAVFVVVAGILGALFMLFSQHAPQVVSSSLAEQQAASNSAEPSPTASPSVSPSPAPTADTVVSLNQLGASGCSAATKDAQLLVDYGKQNSNGPNWKTNDAEAKVVQAMEVLKQKCKGDYAKQVADTAKASGATEALSTTLDEVAGASLAIVSPSGNITCVLSANGVTCNVKDRIYPADQDCAGAEFFTVAVDKTGAVNSCGAAAQSSGGAQRLEYGQSKSEGEFTCTSESSGMTCKHTPTGKGFKVAKEAWSQS
ncbi:MAG: hypothetical protein Q4D79_13810 [Propionibacteriaceae bacterium]|nr:hypothetical protein [Propionibacteriaceae bacterium]